MSDEIRRKLAEALAEVGMHEAAKMALEGFYSDVDSPLATPKMALVDALWTAAEMAKGEERKDEILKVREHVMEGVFDG